MSAFPKSTGRPIRCLPAAVLLILAACSSGDEEASSHIRDLLKRTPSVTIETDTDIVPRRLHIWGDFDGGGWARTLNWDGGPGLPSVLMGGDVATLLFNSTGPRDRKLEIGAWTDGTAKELGLTLNGVQLETLELASSMATATVDVPAAFWKVGRNRLEFHCDTDVADPSEIHVSLVRVSPSGQVELGSDKIELDSGTSIAWRMELIDTAIVDLQLAARTPGLATVVLEILDPLSGGLSESGRREYQLKEGESIAGRIPVPDPGGLVIQLSVDWNSTDGEGSLSIERLGLLEQQPLTRPPILFVSIDTLSAQNLSVYGYGRSTTPHLTDFAKDSVLFEVARVNAPWTVPSYASQFTGLYAWANKRDLPKSGPSLAIWDLYPMPDQRWTLVEMLRSVGYATGAFIDNPLLARLSGFNQGFDVYDIEAGLIGRQNPQGGMHTVFPSAIEFLMEHQGEPAFAFAQILDVHGPYTPQSPFKGRFSDDFDQDDLTVVPVVSSHPPVFGGIPVGIARGRFEGELPASAEAEYFHASYDEGVLEMDAALGALFQELKDKGIYDDLLIIVSADHGESMADHDYFFRHGINYDSIIHVPLIIKMPGQRHAGGRVTSPVQLVDLYPTLSDVLGLSVDRPYFHGRSLLPAIEGRAIEDVPQMIQADLLEHCALVLGRWKLVKSEWAGLPVENILTSRMAQERIYGDSPEIFTQLFGGRPPIDSAHVLEVLAALRKQASSPGQVTQMIKNQLNRKGPGIELYDTQADPHEEHNVAADHPEVVAEMLELMLIECLRAEEMRIESDAMEVYLDEGMRDELRSLGYVGDD